MPGGIARRIVWHRALTCASAPAISVSGWKYTLTTPVLSTDWDSMRSMSLTVVESARSVR